MDLDELRTEIDQIDKKLCQLFEERMDCVLRVATYKSAHQLPILQQSREQEVLKQIQQYLNPDYRQYGKILFSTLIELSRSSQQQKLHSTSVKLQNAIKAIAPFPSTESNRIGCYNIDNQSAHSFVKKFFPNRPISSYQTLKELITAIEKEDVLFGVLPLTNSDAEFYNTLCTLLQQHPIYINQIGKRSEKYPLILSKHLYLDPKCDTLSAILLLPNTSSLHSLLTQIVAYDVDLKGIKSHQIGTKILVSLRLIGTLQDPNLLQLLAGFFHQIDFVSIVGKIADE